MKASRFVTLALVLAALCGFAGAASAQTAKMSAPMSATLSAQEREYLTARDAEITKIKTQLDAGKDINAIGGDDHKALADLETRLRGIVGAVTIAGYGAAKSNLETLIPELGFGQLDGLAVASADNKTAITVTTEPLLAQWLRGHRNWWGEKGAKMPQDLAGALRSEAFYTQATAQGAAMVAYGPLPVTKPQGASLAFAMLAARTQDQSPPAPDRMFVTLVQGGRVSIAEVRLAGTIEAVPACAKAADRAQRRCFAGKMPAAARAKAAQQAQAMLELMAAR